MPTSKKFLAMPYKLEPKPRKVEYAVITSDNLAKLTNLINLELGDTSCTVRLVGGISGMNYPTPDSPFPEFMFYQAITRSYL